MRATEAAWARTYACGAITFPAQRLVLVVYRIWAEGRADLAAMLSLS